MTKQSVPPTALKPILDQHWSTPKNLTPTTPTLDIVQTALDIVEKQCKRLKKTQNDLQQQYKSVTEELKSLKSNVDNGGENKMGEDTRSGNPRSKGKETPYRKIPLSDDESDPCAGDEDCPDPKVNRNSSCDLNPCSLTYPLTHSNV